MYLIEADNGFNFNEETGEYSLNMFSLDKNYISIYSIKGNCNGRFFDVEISYSPKLLRDKNGKGQPYCLRNISLSIPVINGVPDVDAVPDIPDVRPQIQELILKFYQRIKNA